MSDVLRELAETSDYIRETSRIMRRAIDRLVEHEEELMRANRLLSAITDQTHRAIDAALRAQDDKEK